MLHPILLAYALLQVGAAQQSGVVDPATPVTLNNSTLQLVVENQCATKEDVRKIVEETSTASNQCATRQEIQQIVQEAVQAAIGDLLNNSVPFSPVGGSFQHPTTSCKDIPEGSPSGNYWIQDSGTGYASLQYCDTTRRCNRTGGWMKVAYLDMTDDNQHCPPGFTTINSPTRTCGSPATKKCVSAIFPVHGVRYGSVCGRIKAYQYKATVAFQPYYDNRSRTIDDAYVDGISITHGSSPRKHIWTFAAALDETYCNRFVCLCTRPDLPYSGVVPPFIGQDYFCETGSRYRHIPVFYHDDPLWDGLRCGEPSTCCENNQPWFCKQLPQSTTDDIELRLCTHYSSDEDTPIQQFEIFVQ